MEISRDGIFLALPERPAAGIPLAVKDLFDTAGLTTTYGSAIFAEHVPAATAEAVRLLEAAGYANVGKTNLHEFAYGVTSMNPHYGWVPNPVAPGPDRRRLERRLGGRARRGARRRGARHRLGRLDSDPRRVLRHRRVQADLRAGLARGLLAAGAELRPRRADGARRSATCDRDDERRCRGFDPSAAAGPRRAARRARVDGATPIRGVRERVEAAAAHFPDARARRLAARPTATCAVFMREVARGARDALRRAPRRVRRERRDARSRACLEVDRRRGRRGRARRARRTASAGGRARWTASTCSSPRRSGFVAPTYEAGIGDLVLRDDHALHESLQRPRLAGARASVRPRRGRPPGVGPARRPAGGGRDGAGRGPRAGGSSPGLELPKRRSHALLPPSRRSPSSHSPSSREPPPRRAPSSTATLAAPLELHGFLLRADDPPQDTFTRTPSFAWQPVAGAKRYEFQLATARTLPPGAVSRARRRRLLPCRSQSPCRGSPATPYSLYARVRGVAPDGRTGRGARASASTCAGRRCRRRSRRPPVWCAGRRSTARPHTRCGSRSRTRSSRRRRTSPTSASTTASIVTPSWTGVVHWRMRGAPSRRRSTSRVRNGLPETSASDRGEPRSTRRPNSPSPQVGRFDSGSRRSRTAISTTGDDPTVHHLMPAFAFTATRARDGNRSTDGLPRLRAHRQRTA